jgi:S1-C subfamily serine protease
MSVLIGQLDRAACRLVLPEPPAAPLPPHDLAERVLPSVLAVGRLYKCTKCTRVHVSVATGFVISASGACVTNYHVVNEPDSETLVAMTADGRVLAVREVLAASRADDVVLLRVDAADLPPLPLAADAPVGTPVWILSHPDRRFYTLTSGLVSRHFLMAETGGASPRMAVTADYARGSSGAPVFDARGVVVGVAESTHSVYYDKDDDGRPRNLQMVFHNAVPARSVLGLIRRER